MELEKIQKFYQAGQEIGDLIFNAYIISFDSNDEIGLQGHFNRTLVEKYHDKARFAITPGGFVEGHLEIDGLQVRLVFD